jgi:hypothetical protein
MHALSHIALGASVLFGSGSFFSTSALAADPEITVVAPLAHVSSGYLDKANGVGPRIKFFSAPPELSLACALSIGAHVNEGEFVDYPGARTVGEFRTQIANSIQLKLSEAERVPLHETFALGGEGQISGAFCANLKRGPEARGHCSGTISGSGSTVVYSFNPVVCRYDNITVAKALLARLSVGDRDDREWEPDCATKLEGFITDIDDLLAKDPRRLTDVFAVLDRHFPLHDCAVDEASGIVRKSKYFRSIGTNGPKMHVFSLNSETASSRGVSVSFGLWDTGDSSLPFAMWSPPFP